MTQSLATRDNAAIMERAVIQGDLSELTPTERVSYYRAVCESLGLNPYTKPFAYLALKDERGETKIDLYPRAACADQLRDVRGVSITKLETERTDGLYIVRAYAVDARGRSDSAIGAVPIVKEQGEWKSTSNGKRYFEGNGRFIPLTGDALANAIMKAETKAKRRVTLSLCGLAGMPDESEVTAVPHEEIPVDLHMAVDEPQLSALEAWGKVEVEARELGIEHRALPNDAGESKIRRWTQALAEKVKIARNAARHDEIFGSEEDPTTYDTPQRTVNGAGDVVDTSSGEVIEESPSPPNRSELWQENRRLVEEARQRGISGKTLNARSGQGAVEAANEELRVRIAEHDEIERQRQQEGLL